MDPSLGLLERPHHMAAGFPQCLGSLTPSFPEYPAGDTGYSYSVWEVCRKTQVPGGENMGAFLEESYLTYFLLVEKTLGICWP